VWQVLGSPYFSDTSVFRTPPAGSVHVRATRPVLPSRPVLLSRPVLPPLPVSPARLGLADRFRRPARPSICPSSCPSVISGHPAVHPSYPAIQLSIRHIRPSSCPSVISVHPAVHPSYPSPLPPHTEPELRHSSLFTPLDSSGASEEARERLLHC
jgi:hypothetical protein